MIAYLRGTVALKDPTYCIIECAGVGYRVQISLNTFAQLQLKEEALLHTYHEVKEDSERLFGFSDVQERHLFELLISISGVGGNTALLVLSSLRPEELQATIASHDASRLQAIKGIGKKTAERIVLELKDKMDLPASSTGSQGSSPAVTTRAEAIQALVMLGFTKATVEPKVDALLRSEPTLSTEAIIRHVLKG